MRSRLVVFQVELATKALFEQKDFLGADGVTLKRAVFIEYFEKWASVTELQPVSPSHLVQSTCNRHLCLQSILERLIQDKGQLSFLPRESNSLATPMP